MGAPAAVCPYLCMTPSGAVCLLSVFRWIWMYPYPYQVPVHSHIYSCMQTYLDGLVLALLVKHLACSGLQTWKSRGLVKCQHCLSSEAFEISFFFCSLGNFIFLTMPMCQLLISLSRVCDRYLPPPFLENC